MMWATFALQALLIGTAGGVVCMLAMEAWRRKRARDRELAFIRRARRNRHL